MIYWPWIIMYKTAAEGDSTLYSHCMRCLSSANTKSLAMEKSSHDENVKNHLQIVDHLHCFYSFPFPLNHPHTRSIGNKRKFESLLSAPPLSASSLVCGGGGAYLWLCLDLSNIKASPSIHRNSSRNELPSIQGCDWCSVPFPIPRNPNDERMTGQKSMGLRNEYNYQGNRRTAIEWIRNCPVRPAKGDSILLFRKRNSRRWHALVVIGWPFNWTCAHLFLLFVFYMYD